jgi:ADP-ribose pyrophosphatase YjhB (NUDIX family)
VTPRIVVAVGALVVDGDRVLLIQRGHPPGEGLWSIPGGRVEVGETLPEALRREIQEECGIEIAVGDPAIMLDRITRDAQGNVRSHYLILDFWATPVVSPTPPVCPSDDARDAGWFTLDQIRQLPTTNKLADYIAEALRRQVERVPGCLVVGD